MGLSRGEKHETVDGRFQGRASRGYWETDQRQWSWAGSRDEGGGNGRPGRS